MATEVKHGAGARFRTKGVRGDYYVVVNGHYTAMRQRGAGGVTEFAFKSGRKVKRRNELLVLRTCFLEWFLQQWIKNDGKRRVGIWQVKKYPFRRKYGPRGGLKRTAHSTQRREGGRK